MYSAIVFFAKEEPQMKYLSAFLVFFLVLSARLEWPCCNFSPVENTDVDRWESGSEINVIIKISTDELLHIVIFIL